MKYGLEPILSEVSSGHFLPPVQTLAATSIFCHRQKMQIESYIVHRVQIHVFCHISFLSSGQPLAVGQVLGSNPTSSTKRKPHPKGWGFSFGMVFEIGLEPILREVSSGHFLPPVQTLVATSIFCHRQKKQIESYIVHHT